MNLFRHPAGHASAALLLLAALAPGAARACATCGCSLSTDAAMGYSADAGWRLNLQFDFIDQRQLRLGSGAISAQQAAAVNDAGGSQEVERRTTNRYTTLGIGYSADADWNVRLMLPYIDRSHTTYGAATNPLTDDEISAASAQGLGDARFIAGYQGFLPTHNLGVQLGLKLPTGHYGGGPAADGSRVGHRYVDFASGPNAGAPLDTSLQLGTGSTDLIVGGYYYQPVSQDFDFFVNGQFQAAVQRRLKQPGADYRPGNAATVSFGLRYEADPALVPQIQVNTTRKNADQGFLADTADSAGTVVYLSPGVTVSVGHAVSLYGFAQVPIYSKLAGYQLFPRWTASVGASLAF